jgi:hypothetical protein
LEEPAAKANLWGFYDMEAVQVKAEALFLLTFGQDQRLWGRVAGMMNAGRFRFGWNDSGAYRYPDSRQAG